MHRFNSHSKYRNIVCFLCLCLCYPLFSSHHVSLPRPAAAPPGKANSSKYKSETGACACDVVMTLLTYRGHVHV